MSDVRPDGRKLFLLGFLTLFLELTLIRYLAGSIWNLGYFPNLVLIGVFVGMGLGFVSHHLVPEPASGRLFTGAAVLLGLLVVLVVFLHPAVPGFTEYQADLGGELFFTHTPNAANAVGLAAAVDYLEAIGMDEVRLHERELIEIAMTRLSAIDGIRIYGPAPEHRSGVVSFTLGDVHPHDLATILDGAGVCIRAGHHCAQPLMRRLNVPATARASFYVYNDESDVDALVAGIMTAKKLFGDV